MNAEEIRTRLRGAEISIVPYAHCDWAWTHTRAWHERRYVRIFEEVLELLRAEPDFRWYLDCWITELRPLLDRRPELLPELQARIREGTITICGAFSNVRPNMVGEETFIRSLAHGRRRFRDLFPEADLSVHADIVDVALGHPQMPQVLRLAGYRYFRAWRPQAALSARGVPYEWVWEGLDGSRILCSRGCYGGFFYDDSLPHNLTDDWDRTVVHLWEKELEQAARLSPTGLIWLSLGCDDARPLRVHGSDKLLDIPGLIREWNRREHSPMRFATPVEFYQALEQRLEQVPVVAGTLDPCDVCFNAAWGGAHGLWRRRVETDRELASAEIWQAVAPAGPDPQPELRELWESLLLFSAHATQWLYQDDFDELDALARATCTRARAVRRRSLEALARRVPQPEGCSAIVFNQLPYAREAVVPVLLTAANGIPECVRLTDGAGRDVPYQIANNLATGTKLWERQVVARVSLPALGYTTVTWEPDEGSSECGRAEERESGGTGEWQAEAAADPAVRAYLEAITDVPALQPEDEAGLVARAAEGDEDARCRLTETHLHLVVEAAAGHLGQGLSALDLIQEGNVGLVQAVEQLNRGKGCRFRTYAAWWIGDALARAIAERGARQPASTHLQDDLQRLARASHALRDDLGREPSLDELAARVELPAEQVAGILRLAPDPLASGLPSSIRPAPGAGGVQVPTVATVAPLLQTHRQLTALLGREPTLEELAAAVAMWPRDVADMLAPPPHPQDTPAAGASRVSVLSNGVISARFREGHLISIGSPQGEYPAPDGLAWSLLRLYETDPNGPLHVGEIRGVQDVRWDEHQLVEQGPVRWRYLARGTVGHQPVVLETLLLAGEARIEFRVQVDWRPHDGFFAVLWPMPFEGILTGDVPFGAEVKDLDREAFGPMPEANSGNIERYREGMFYARSFVSLADGRHGVSFVSHNGDRYYIRDREQRTLAHLLIHSIRKVTEGWEKDVNVQEQVAEGRHTFAWSLLFHTGDWRAANLVRRSASLRHPPEVLLPKGAPAPDLPSERSFLSLEPDHVVLSALYADGDSVLLRVWEGEGLPAQVAVRLPFAPLTAAPVDLNGDSLPEPSVHVDGAELRFSLRPWQIATVKLHR